MKTIYEMEAEQAEVLQSAEYDRGYRFVMDIHEADIMLGNTRHKVKRWKAIRAAVIATGENTDFNNGKLDAIDSILAGL